jgi:23S rRNA (guanosine2251-2'-O)-methyltransferase
MRESYRDKQNRKARIAREKEKKEFEKKGKKSFATRENQRDFSKRDFQRNKGNQSIRTNRNNQEFRNQVEEKDYEDVVAGRNAVLELLKSDKDINKIFIERGEKHGSINEIIAKAKDAKIVLVEVDRSKLDTMAENHQGVVAIVPPFNYCEVEDILEEAKNKNEDPFIIIWNRRST